MKLHVHSESVFTIPDFLSPERCRALIADAERRGFSKADVKTADGQKSMPTIRNNDRMAFSSPELAAGLWSKLSLFDLPQIDQMHAVGLAALCRFYRYEPGQRFKMHKDGRLKEDGLESRLSFLVYLNTDCEGGETDFKTFKISPEEGTALLFVHETWHEGAVLISGKKYVFRSDVMYGK